MKVLFFITSLSLRTGGPSRSVPLLARGLAEVGLEVTLLTIREEDMNTHALAGSGVRFIAWEPGFSRRQLEAFVVQEGFDLIQGQSIWSLHYHALSRIAAKHDIPYISTPRGMLEPWSLARKSLKKRLALFLYQRRDLQQSACIFTTSELEAGHVRELGFTNPVSVIPNGVELDSYTCRESLAEVKPQVLFLSRIHEKKGIEMLLQAWADVAPQFAGWTLLIVGNGEQDYIGRLRNLVEDKGLRQSVRLLPPVFGQAKRRLFCESALFVLPSYSENFGMAVAEALACGVPVITTEHTPWLLLNGKEASMGIQPEEPTGWCIEASPHALAAALEQALSMEAEARYELGRKGSRLAHCHLNYRTIAGRTKDLYLWIAGQGPKPTFMYD